ncbi:uncharacterized protein LOC126686677 [Mercurialis annua]|uniref:uncharacterized protein LOC126686677 n=1 Tax=Mercurialis annua TaxID=3986 RepID=UPI00215FB23A|nr:uncharacterized protein LOC126686677 [Mercurialis annua]
MLAALQRHIRHRFKRIKSTPKIIHLNSISIRSSPTFLFPSKRKNNSQIRFESSTTKMDKKAEDMSSAEAVFLGALAPGVNGPTWNTLKSAFVLLGVSLAVMFGLAFSSSDVWLILHVGFLVLITSTLFLLLSWFLSQTGLVAVEHQMREIGLVPNDHKE